jgi:HEAT repeat protein
MLKQSLIKLLPVILLSLAQCAGLMNLGCELSPPKVMAQQQGDENAKIEKLIQQLRSKNDVECNNAAIALGKMGASAESAISDLSNLLDSKPEYIRVNASLAIKQIVKLTQSETSSLLPLLKHPNPDIRANVATAIGRRNFVAALDLFILGMSLQDSNLNRKVRAHLVAAMESIPQSSNEIIPYLIPLLKDSNANVRANAALAISFTWTGNKSVSPQLITSLIPLFQDTNATVRANAVGAIGSMGSWGRGSAIKSTMPDILPLFHDPDANVRLSAITSIFNIGALERSAMPQILTLFHDPDRKVRLAAVMAIYPMETSDLLAAIPQLAMLLKDSDGMVRYFAAQLLEGMGESAKSAIPGLDKIIQESRLDKRNLSEKLEIPTAVKAARSTIPNLIPLLKDPDPRIRYIAADALGEIGDAAKSAIPQLIPLLKDPNKTVVNRTRSALKKLGYQ